MFRIFQFSEHCVPKLRFQTGRALASPSDEPHAATLNVHLFHSSDDVGSGRLLALPILLTSPKRGAMLFDTSADQAPLTSGLLLWNILKEQQAMAAVRGSGRQRETEGGP